MDGSGEGSGAAGRATTPPPSDVASAVPATPTASSAAAAAAEASPEKRLCRYCLCGDGDDDGGGEDAEDEDLVSPCACRGDQRWVHLSCLRRWQRSILICQPTHPAFYTHDRRHKLCSVCRTEFTVPPPSRAQLMRELTGEEMASMYVDVVVVVVVFPEVVCACQQRAWPRHIVHAAPMKAGHAIACGLRHAHGPS
jgi:hypothetical protein